MADLDLDALAQLPLAYVTGTGLAREPSRTATLAVVEARAAAGTRTIFDTDWRPMLWDHPEEYPTVARIVAARSAVVLGGVAELKAAGLGTDAAPIVVRKEGPDGAVVVHDGVETRVPGLPVPVVNGLGAGDAFAAAFGAALLRGETPEEAAHQGNAAGAIVATRLACSDAMPTRDELVAFLEENARV